LIRYFANSVTEATKLERFWFKARRRLPWSFRLLHQFLVIDCSLSVMSSEANKGDSKDNKETVAVKEGTEVAKGVVKEVIKVGSGPLVQKGDEITVHCTGTYADTGVKFWSTKDDGQKPFTFLVGQGIVLPGWEDGLQTMSKGEISKLKLEPSKAHGSGGNPNWNIPPNATLVFEIEIISVKEKTSDK